MKLASEESYNKVGEIGLCGLKIIKESWIGDQHYTLKNSMICPLRESDFPMVLYGCTSYCRAIQERLVGRELSLEG
jgi:hypothetical protein